MERDVNGQYSESLVRKITTERERFVFALQQGASGNELKKIRESIKELNDLLWETTLQHARVKEFPDAVFKGVRKTG